jgi:hypothetical protein
MKLATWQASVPLLVDHHEGTRVGTVDELSTFSDVDGDWLVARAELYPDAPDWIKKGSPASFLSACLNESSFIPGYIYGAYAREVSILQRQKPAEPGARLIFLYEPVPGRPRKSMRSSSRGEEIIHPRGTILRRNTGQILGVR